MKEGLYNTYRKIAVLGLNPPRTAILLSNLRFYCQYAKNTLTVLAVNVTARQAFTTWQAGPTHTGFANWQAVSGWLFTTSQAVYRSGPAPIFAPARWEHIPNPEIALCASCAFFAKRFFMFISLLTIRMRYSISISIRTFISDYSFLFTGTQIALW